MYRHFLVEQGIELELDAEIVDVVDFIDKNISTFTCGEHGFKISSGKGVVNAQWKLLVRPRELMNPKVQKDPIGCIMVDAEIVDVVDFIDKNISTFTCGEHGFKISSGKGVVNAQWKLLVRPRELMNPKVQKDPIGCIMVERMEGSMTRLTIPPREQYGEDGGSPTELESKLFLSFICQILNRLQDRGFIELPGFVPVE